MTNIKYLGFFLLLIFGCQKENTMIKEDSDTVTQFDSISTSCIPVSMEVTDLDYNILGYSFYNPNSVYDLFDFQFLNINLSDRKLRDTIIQHNQDENFRETPYKIRTNVEDVFMLGKFNHWDDFSDIYLFPYFICQSKSGRLKWEASIGNRRSLSNNFHIYNNRLFLFSTSFPSDNDYFSLTTDILRFNGEIEKSIRIDSVNILVQTSMQLNDTQFIIVGRTDWDEAKDIQLYSIDTVGKKNWHDIKNLEHHVDFKSSIQLDSCLILMGNVLDAGAGLLYSYDLMNKSISIFTTDENSKYFDLISSGNYIYLLKGETQNGSLISSFLEIYTASGELIRTVLLKNYNNTKSIAFDLDSDGNIIITGDVNDKLYFTRLNSYGDTME